MGTGAFSRSSAARTVTVEIATDDGAYLRLTPGSGAGDEFVTAGPDGVVSIDVGVVDNGTGSQGQGVNPGSVTALRDVLAIENRGTETVTVSQEPANAGVALFDTYNGPESMTLLQNPAGMPTVGVGASVEVGLVVDTGYDPDSVPGELTGSTANVGLTVVADAE